MAGANAAAPSGPSSLYPRSSCAQERDSGEHGCDEQGEWEPWVKVHAGLYRWAGVWSGLDFSVPRLVRRCNLEGLRQRRDAVSSVRALQITIIVVVEATELIAGKVQLQAQADKGK